MAIIEAVKSIFAGIGVGFQALFSAFSFYKEISDLNDKVIAAFIGVPVIFVSLVGLVKIVFRVIRLVSKWV